MFKNEVRINCQIDSIVSTLPLQWIYKAQRTFEPFKISIAFSILSTISLFSKGKESK